MTNPYYNRHINPMMGMRVSSAELRDEFDRIAAGFDAVPVIAELEAVQAAADAALASANYKGLWSSLSGPLAIPASVMHDGVLYMLLESVADVTAEEPGVSAKWRALLASPVRRIARTSNTQISGADSGRWIDITGGTFTQTVAACSILGAGWWCYLANSGLGDITLAPSGAETIDGLSSYVMYPGEVRLVQCDGSTLRTVVLKPFRRKWTAAGSFIKPPGYQEFFGVVCGAGGGGGGGAKGTIAAVWNGGAGGGGGGYGQIAWSASAIGASALILPGAGGAGGAGSANGTPTAGVAGGSTSIVGVISAEGGTGAGIYANSPGVGGRCVTLFDTQGGAGGDGSTGGGGVAGALCSAPVPTGGGGGGSCNTSAMNSTTGGAGGNSGNSGYGSAVLSGGVAGTSGGGAGGNGNAGDNLRPGTGGGGGGGSHVNAAVGAKGGDGRDGGGGGGGGAANNAVPGAGGTGGDGFVVISGRA